MVPKVVAFPGYTPNQVREQFVDAVSQDVIRPTEAGQAVYGLPFALDTLSLFTIKISSIVQALWIRRGRGATFRTRSS